MPETDFSSTGPEKGVRKADLLPKAFTARSPSFCFTAKQTECSEDAWLIMTTLQLASRMVPKMAAAVPCTPTIPVPSTLISATLSIVAKPFTMTGPVRSTSVCASLMTVPAIAEHALIAYLLQGLRKATAVHLPCSEDSHRVVSSYLHLGLSG